jgi:protein-tyrosine phosphatase
MWLVWPIVDGPLPDAATLVAVARFVSETIHAGRMVLVRCGAGLERAPLVVATILMELGWTAETAINHLREIRGPDCLTNPAFAGWLRDRVPKRA